MVASRNVSSFLGLGLRLGMLFFFFNQTSFENSCSCLKYGRENLVFWSEIASVSEHMPHTFSLFSMGTSQKADALRYVCTGPLSVLSTMDKWLINCQSAVILGTERPCWKRPIQSCQNMFNIA